MPRNAPRTPLIRVRKGNTLLLNRIYLHYGLPYQAPYSSAGRIEAGLICKRLLVGSATNMSLLPRVLSSICSAKHRTPSSPICLSEVIRKPFALSRVFPLSSGGKSVLLMKKKAPSHSGFPASMYVVLKTRYVNPNIHVRRY